MMAEHTNTPWVLGVDGVGDIFDADNRSVAKTDAWNVSTHRTPRENRANAAFIVKAVNSHDALVKALSDLVDAEALSGVRTIVAGWNGEGRDEPYQHRHPDKLGATLPKTTCGAVYELDEALQRARAALASIKVPS